jgi:hypothetical protein
LLSRYYHHAAASASSTFAAATLALSPTRYYRVGESSGTNAVDAAGVQDATYVNSPTLGVAGITTDGDTGITLTAASSQYVTAADHADYDIGTSDWSLMMGVRWPSAWPVAQEYLVTRNGFGAGGWGFYASETGNGNYRVIMNGSDYGIAGGAGAGFGAYRFLGLSVDRSALATLYVDGSSVGTVDVSAAVAVDLQRTADLYIGRLGTGANYLGASADEFGFWKSRLISGAEWAALQAAR